MSQYQLPFQYRCLDRFSILPDDAEGDDGLVCFGDLIVALLARPVADVSDIIDILDTISHTLREDGGDFMFLRDFLQRHPWQPFWERLVPPALALPVLFPEGHLKILQPGDSRSLSAEQTLCLVAHQFLCTLRTRPERGVDGYVDFSIWFHSSQRHPAAAEAYLTAVLRYISGHQRSESFVGDRSDVQYDLRSLSLSGPVESVPLAQLMVTHVERFSTDLQEYRVQGPNGAVVVAANKIIGFGQTATQEEIFMGNCPQAAPAVLFAPPLQDDCALVITGAEAMLRITGDKRNIARALGSAPGGRMLLMDALELDMESTPLPDLIPSNVEREVRKAAAAFASPGIKKVFTGLWGCGAFGGNAAIKLVILWYAASWTGVDLVVITDQLVIATAFTDFARRFGGDAEDLLRLLDRVPPGVVNPVDILTQWTSGM